MSRRDRAWLDYAIRIAYGSNAVKRHGAVIVKGGSVRGVGFNKYVNSPFKVSEEHLDRCSVHAEIAAIRNARGSVKGATLYVARINNRGMEMYSAPCNKCQDALEAHGIRKVVWT